jgi:hypothetical protein
MPTQRGATSVIGQVGNLARDDGSRGKQEPKT